MSDKSLSEKQLKLRRVVEFNIGLIYKELLYSYSDTLQLILYDTII